ncbi:OmpA family protein [Pseudooceanicola onchidii]|uniref:OmpA family protein n=1 Tax=Pseudooceanicola onchidii TaxID=2562279 RepID=UPI001F0CDEFF|nr:OmpA family protein [Pseudooceanicola onchidii]
MRLALAAYLALGVATPVMAFEPGSLPEAAEPTHDRQETPAALSVPVGVYDGTLPMLEVEGALRERAWRVPSAALSTLRIIEGLRVDLAQGGYFTILDCRTQACGGFDFRFGLPVLPAPAMNVDLFDFRVLVAQKGEGPGAEYVYILVSRGRSNRFVQVMEVVTTPEDQPAPEALAITPAESPPETPEIITRLQDSGHVVLKDLDFASGAGTLSDRSYATLEALAGYLKANPARIIALVGHTDATGSLEANTALSRKRAEAVRARLIGKYEVPGGQVVAQGAGYLAPVASNLTQAGREANRRVEAVLLAAE